MPSQANPTNNTNPYTTWPIHNVSNAPTSCPGNAIKTQCRHTSVLLQSLLLVPVFTQPHHFPTSISSLPLPPNKPTTVNPQFYPHILTAQPFLVSYSKGILIPNYQQQYQVPIQQQPQPNYLEPVPQQQSIIYHGNATSTRGALNEQGRHPRPPLPEITFNRQNNCNPTNLLEPPQASAPQHPSSTIRQNLGREQQLLRLEVEPRMTAFTPDTQSEQLDLCLNIDKNLRTAYAEEKRFSGKYDDKWMLHRCNLLIHCQ